MSEAARSRRDGARYEPQLDVLGRDASPRPPSASDPLAELARLIGQDDPYRDVFRPAPPRDAAPVAFHAADWKAPADEATYHDDASDHGGAHAAAVGHHDDDGSQDHGGHLHEGHIHEGHLGGDAGHYDAYPPQAYGDHATYPDDHAASDYAAAEGQHPTYADDAGMADQRLAEDAVGASAIPDLWARGEDIPRWTSPEAAHVAAPAERLSAGRSAARRPLAVLSAVLLLTCGGLAGTFLAKGNTNNAGMVSASGSRGAPTIMAASGPTKVKVDDGSATAPEDRDAALLNGTGNVSAGPVKVVSNEEQPTDLSLLPKSDLAAGARPLPPAVPSPFPEPKRVKTFVVRPDGTMLSGDGTSAPTGSTAGAGKPAATATLAPPADDTPASPLPATPTTAAKGGTTPQQPVMLGDALASLTADPAPDDAPAAKPARPPHATVGHPAPAKPARVAAASPPSGGSYGLQLASSPVEAEANGAFAKLKKKFPDQLGAYTASVHKFETGDKPIYRVRVGGMSQDEAKTLCSQLQSAGGTCFVVRN